MNQRTTRKKTYHFQTRSDAESIAGHAIRLGGKNIRLMKIPSGFSVSFASTWETELEILSAEVLGNSNYRSGNRWSPEEKHYVIDAFLGWHPIDAIANKLRRTSNSISAMLFNARRLERAGNLQDSWDDVWGCLNDEDLSTGKNIDDWRALAAWGLVSDGDAYGPVAELEERKIDTVFKILMWFDNWDCASRFALELGDAERAFKLARQGGSPLQALQVLNSWREMPDSYLNHRLRLQAAIGRKIIEELPKEIEKWVIDAKWRVDNYYARISYGSGQPIYPIEVALGVPREKFPDELLALVGTKEELEELVLKGNKLAACFLSDYFFHPSYFADEDRRNPYVFRVQDNYWPTRHEIGLLLEHHLSISEHMRQDISHLVSAMPYGEWLTGEPSYYKFHLFLSHDAPEPVCYVSEEDDDPYY